MATREWLTERRAYARALLRQTAAVNFGGATQFPSNYILRCLYMHEGPGSGRAEERFGQLSSNDLSSAAPAPSPVQLAGTVLRHRYLLLGLPIAVAMLAFAVSLALPRTYTVSASFTPQEPEASVPLVAGLAARLGLTSQLATQGGNPAYFASVLTSNEILRRAAETEYSLSDGAGQRTGDLAFHLGISAPTPERRLKNATKKLERAVDVRTSRETGIVEFSVRTRDPGLSYSVTRRLLELLNEFNLDTRTTFAGEERRFLESRVSEARESLVRAEDGLQAFLQENRRFEQSPELRFRHDRLSREVGLRQQVYMALLEAMEEARHAEVRNLPVLMPLESPRFPAEPDDRHLLLRAALGMLAGLVVAIAWTLTRESFFRARLDDPDGYSQLEGLWERTLLDFRRARFRLPPAVRSSQVDIDEGFDER